MLASKPDATLWYPVPHRFYVPGAILQSDLEIAVRAISSKAIICPRGGEYGFGHTFGFRVVVIRQQGVIRLEERQKLGVAVFVVLCGVD